MEVQGPESLDRPGLSSSEPVEDLCAQEDLSLAERQALEREPPAPRALILNYLQRGGAFAEQARRRLRGAQAAAAAPRPARTPTLPPPPGPLAPGLDRTLVRIAPVAESRPDRPDMPGVVILPALPVPAGRPVGGGGAGRPDLRAYLEGLAGGPPEGIVAGQAWLCRLFRATDGPGRGGGGYGKAYARVLHHVRTGLMPASDVDHAVAYALGPGIRNRGAAFAADLRRSAQQRAAACQALNRGPGDGPRPVERTPAPGPSGSRS